MADDPLRRAVRWLVVMLVVVYAPIALTATWADFVPGAPRLQDLLDRQVGGAGYASGPGSVRALRHADYVDHRVLMLLHTVLGTLCLLLAVRQLFGTGRSHRVLGRAHLVLVTVAMGAAVLFLLATSPGPGAGQTAFRVQLWVLAASTLGTAWLAAFEARRGHLRAHRSWMILHVAFLLTAPVLRLGWTLLAPLLPNRTMLANIESGAILLAVAAPAVGVMVALRALGVVRERGTGVAVPLLATGAGLGAVVVAGAALSLPHGYVVFHVVPVVIVALWCCRRGGSGRGLLGCAAAMPWSVLALAAPAAAFLGWPTALATGLMVAPGFPLVACLATVVARLGTESSRDTAERPPGPGTPQGRRDLLTSADV